MTISSEASTERQVVLDNIAVIEAIGSCKITTVRIARNLIK